MPPAVELVRLRRDGLWIAVVGLVRLWRIAWPTTMNDFPRRCWTCAPLAHRLTNNSKRFSSPNVLLICRPPESGFGFSLLFAWPTTMYDFPPPLLLAWPTTTSNSLSHPSRLRRVLKILQIKNSPPLLVDRTSVSVSAYGGWSLSEQSHIIIDLMALLQLVRPDWVGTELVRLWRIVLPTTRL